MKELHLYDGGKTWNKRRSVTPTFLRTQIICLILKILL